MSSEEPQIKEEESLYTTLKKLYDGKNPCSRIILMCKIKQVVDPNARRRDKEKEKALNKNTNANFLSELRSFLSALSARTNLMIIYVGTLFAFVGLENSTENLMEVVRKYISSSSMVTGAKLIHFNEECPFPCFPVFYKYEGEVYEKESNIYKDVSPSEKAWLLYDCFFCGLGRVLRGVIYSESDFESKTKQIVSEENNYVKYLPTINEISVFESSDFMSLSEFCEMYLDEPRVEFDEKKVFPYYWPLNI